MKKYYLILLLLMNYVSVFLFSTHLRAEKTDQLENDSIVNNSDTIDDGIWSDPPAHFMKNKARYGVTISSPLLSLYYDNYIKEAVSLQLSIDTTISYDSYTLMAKQYGKYPKFRMMLYFDAFGNLISVKLFSLKYTEVDFIADIEKEKIIFNTLAMSPWPLFDPYAVSNDEEYIYPYAIWDIVLFIDLSENRIESRKKLYKEALGMTDKEFEAIEHYYYPNVDFSKLYKPNPLGNDTLSSK